MTTLTGTSVTSDPTYRVFQAIAGKYDRTNCLVSLGMHKKWQRKLVREVQNIPHEYILDVACGTGALTEQLACLKGVHVTGVDPNDAMLDVAEERRMRAKQRLGKKIKRGQQVPNPLYIKGYAEELPLEEESFQVVTVAYGLRNMVDRSRALQQMFRVLKREGRLYILEFSMQPEDAQKKRGRLFWLGVKGYIRYVLPFLGWLGTGEKAAYDYLRDSVETFPHPRQIKEEMKEAGFNDVTYTRFFPGVAVLYTGVK